ncbi:capsular exopolysaccharide synthesis family protein [Sagittula marina]|uniref:non-specific protein-tyrosine kinase n=1 Tax=Sagittula marina TaxID=943940 RepID=A0A7W6DSM4_9RHOB|nr:polysaccharide biosynthesis tyrosine autokinase [Sagittula marina]MBB3988450.1 capsular exopolysaccharide synthesis family protein [Sagittula marina]
MLDITQVFQTLWGRKLFILLCAVLVGLLGALYAYGVAQPLYRAQASLVIETQTTNVVDIENIFNGNATEDAAINTELRRIKARRLLAQVVEKLDLLEDPEFRPTIDEPGFFSVSGISTRLAGLVTGNTWQRPSEDYLKRKTIENLGGSINVSLTPNTYIINISVTTSDSEKSQIIANTLTEIYLSDLVTGKLESTAYVVDWLSERVSELEVELAEREDAIKALQRDSELINREALDAQRIRAKSLRQDLEDTNLLSAEIQARLETIANLLQEPNPTIALSTVIDTQIQQSINSSMTPAQTRARLTALEASQQSRLAREQSRQMSLEKGLKELLDSVRIQERDLQEITQLEREANATRALYETFLTRLKEASLQVGLQQTDTRFESPAIEGQLVAPNKRAILMLCLVLGALTGAAWVLMDRFLRHAVNSTDELKQITGLPVFGQVPVMPFRSRTEEVAYLNDKPTSSGAEAIRNLRTSMLMASPNKPKQIIMTTSSIPGEGKTTLAVALAHSLAFMGKKVLLMEADLRRSTLMKHFDAQQAHGLLDVVSQDVTLEAALYHSKELGADILFGKQSSINAADFFSSTEFERFLAELRNHYDHVILDCPPVLVVPDARIISRYVDVMIYNVGWNTTEQGSVTAGLRQFKVEDIPVLGLSLSNVNMRKVQKYGYDSYSSYGAYGGSYYNK